MKKLIKISIIFLLTFSIAELIMRVFTSSFYADEKALFKFRSPVNTGERKGLKIAMLGDSFTYGVKVADNETLPYKLEENLRKKLQRDDIYVDNFGIAGTSTIEHYNIFTKYIEKKDYDIVILNFFIDDFTPYYYFNTLLNEYKYCTDIMNGYERIISFFLKSRIFEYIFVKYDIYEKSEKAGGFITPISYMIIGMREESSLRYRCARHRLLEIGQRIRSSGKKGILMLIPSLPLYDSQNPYPEEMAGYETMAMMLARKGGFEVIDSIVELRDLLDQRHLVKNDMHYNRDGYRLLSELLSERIIPILGR